EDPGQINQVRLGVLSGSLVSALIGALVLLLTRPAQAGQGGEGAEGEAAAS
ncbi:MAG: Na(+)/H(+) antiporter NhaA, partial [Alphaproteobacteria bacterium]